MRNMNKLRLKTVVHFKKLVEDAVINRNELKVKEDLDSALKGMASSVL
jgi:hypothetical protein